ncbi:Ig-like domain-containing protein [Mesorhizobium sp. M0659]|uniref:Ig-like domain-containing protein n=1 Tax=Mesorhizobium sp. M0659 TaxID=2956980 RepID=UPI003335A2D0
MTDADGSTGTTSFTVVIDDDLPTAANDTWASTVTGPTVLIDLLANDKFGADGVDTDNNPVSGQVTATNGAHGTVTYNNDGTFTYTPTGIYVGSDSFTYTIKDGDGDTSTATVTLNVQTNTVPSGGGTASLTLNEAALDTTLDASAPADLQAGAVTGTNPGSRGETAQAISGITFTTTGEAIDVAFANPTGDPNWVAPTVSGLASGYTISWALVGNQLVGSLIQTAGSVNLGAFVYLALSNTHAGANSSLTPVVTATLTDQLQHLAGSGNVTINGLQVVATDTSGDHVSGSVNLTVLDDAPLPFTPDTIFAEDVAHVSAVVGNLNFANAAGADGVGDVVFNVTELSPVTDLTGQNIFFNGEQVLYHVVNPHTIEGRTSLANGNDLAFTATLDPLNGTWSFTPAGTLYAGNPLNTASVAPSGGNNQVIAFNFPGTQDLLVTANGSNTVNTSTGNFGVGSGQSIAGGETVRFDFVKNASTDGSSKIFGGYYEASSFTTSITKTNKEPIMTIRGVNADGDTAFFGDAGDTTAAGIVVFVTNAGGSLTPLVTYAGGIATVTGLEEGDIIKVVATTDAFSAIEFTGVDNPATSQSDNFKLGPAQFTTTDEASPFNVAIPVIGTDGDGDPISATVNASLTPDPATLEGTNSGDALIATSVIHNLFGLDGNDTLTGLDGQSNLLAGGRGDDTLNGGSGADQLYGGSGVDTLIGGGGNDTLVGGANADTLTGGAGADTFVFGAGDSTPVIGGSGNAGTISGYDTIIDWGFGGTADKLDFGVAPIAAIAISGFDGTDSALTFGGQTIKSDAISANGIITFDDADTYANALSLNTAGGVAAAVQYLMANDIGGAGTTVAFVGNGNTYVYEQTTTNAGGTLVQLTGITNITNLNTLITNGAVDPIILDLNHDGFAFSDLNHGVQFDINGDGTKDQVAWNTSNDGMLAIDLNHDGKVDDGTELFTPSFGGRNFASGAAALASLDSNHDGVIDHSDAAFDSLLIWKDANANGISDAGELSNLAHNDITSISTTTTSAVGEIDGQTVTGNGTFQMADGTTGNYVEVELDTSLAAPAQPAIASDGSKTFAIGSLEVADLIADFHDGDKIDLSSLLKGLAGVTDLVGGGFVEIAQSSANAANAEVKVDTDGGGDNYHTVAVLENYTFHSAADAVKILYDDSHGTKTDVA